MAIRKAINSFIEFFYFPFLRFIPLKTFKYAACGGSTVIIDIIVYWICYHFIFLGNSIDLGFHVFEPHTLAQTCSFMVIFPLGFVLNKFVVFTASDLKGRVQLFRYGLTAVGSFALTILFLKLFNEVFNWNEDFSKILATALVIAYSYLSQQYFTFREKGETD